MARLRLDELFREVKCHTFKDRARFTGLPESTLHKLCGGSGGRSPAKRIELRTLGQLCDAFGIGVNDLIEHHPGFLHKLKTEYSKVRIVVGSRKIDRVPKSAIGRAPKSAGEVLHRHYLDPWDVRSISHIQSALSRAGVGTSEGPAATEVQVLLVLDRVPEESVAGAPGTLTITVGSPATNPLLLPVLDQIARQNCDPPLSRPHARVRMRMYLGHTPLPQESEGLLPILVDRCELTNDGVSLDPTSGIVIEDVNAEPIVIPSTPRGKLQKAGQYQDAGAILICEETSLIAVFGCGGIATLAAAQYLENHLAAMATRIGPTCKQLCAFPLKVMQTKRSDGPTDDREAISCEPATAQPVNNVLVERD